MLPDRTFIRIFNIGSLSIAWTPLSHGFFRWPHFLRLILGLEINGDRSDLIASLQTQKEYGGGVFDSSRIVLPCLK
jgi:hypothetical protein